MLGLTLFLLLETGAQAEDERPLQQTSAALDAKDYDKAFKLIAEAFAAGPLSADWQEVQARTLYQSRNFEEAIEAYLKLGALQPARLDQCAAGLAACYLLSGQPHLAEPYFQKALAAADLIRLRWFLAQMMQGKTAEV